MSTISRKQVEKLSVARFTTNDQNCLTTNQVFASCANTEFTSLAAKQEKRATKQVCLAPRGKTPNMNFFLLSAFSLLLFNLVPRVFSFSSIGKREDPGVEVIPNLAPKGTREGGFLLNGIRLTRSQYLTSTSRSVVVRGGCLRLM